MMFHELDDKDIAHRLASSEALRSKSKSPVLKGEKRALSADEEISLLIWMFEAPRRKIETIAMNVGMSSTALPPTKYQRKRKSKQSE